MYNISVLTSSRADYGIYRPLLQLLQEHEDINVQIIAFGTHTSTDYGHTVDAIRNDGFDIKRELVSVLDGSTPATVAVSMANTMKQFAEVWNELPTDLIICLGDRYEMFSAVAASVPFSIPVAHIHGGETTLGAIDNKFRHCLTHMATLHFASSELYCQKIIEMTGSANNVFNTGALSIDNLSSLKLLTKEDFKTRFCIDLNKPTILTTFHPETVSFEMNEEYAMQLCLALDKLSADFQVLITMPNADTMGNIIRQQLIALAEGNSNIFAFENLGVHGYLSAMKYCTMLVGNTSSGFIEASYFPKWVVNLGKRQEGRLLTYNIRTIEIDCNKIIDNVNDLYNRPVPALQHPYGDGSAANSMMGHILHYLKASTHEI